jgi:branched-chain amino acid aminotransferase
MKIFRMEDKYTFEELRNGLVDVVRANEYKEDIAVRQTVFLDGFGNWSSKGPVNMFIAPVPQGRLPQAGFNCCVSSWQRISDRNLSPKVKVGANYINSRMAQLEALASGFDSAIFMNELGKISEAPGSCFFMVRDGQLITPPLGASILESITRRTIMELAKTLPIQVLERDIDRTELYICEEAFLCGSAVEIMPVSSVDRIPTKCANEGEITRRLRALYLEVVRGKYDDYADWLTPIY